jgi:hypothetical protein
MTSTIADTLGSSAPTGALDAWGTTTPSCLFADFLSTDPRELRSRARGPLKRLSLRNSPRCLELFFSWPFKHGSALRSLRSLDLGFSLDDDELRVLCPRLDWLPQLRHLSLRGTICTESVVKDICDSKLLSRLRSLDLAFTGLDDGSGVMLAEAIRRSKRTSPLWLDVSATSITVTTVNAFAVAAAALPALLDVKTDHVWPTSRQAEFDRARRRLELCLTTNQEDEGVTNSCNWFRRCPFVLWRRALDFRLATTILDKARATHRGPKGGATEGYIGPLNIHPCAKVEMWLDEAVHSAPSAEIHDQLLTHAMALAAAPSAGKGSVEIIRTVLEQGPRAREALALVRAETMSELMAADNDLDADDGDEEVTTYQE